MSASTSHDRYEQQVCEFIYLFGAFHAWVVLLLQFKMLVILELHLDFLQLAINCLYEAHGSPVV